MLRRPPSTLTRRTPATNRPPVGRGGDRQDPIRRAVQHQGGTSSLGRSGRTRWDAHGSGNLQVLLREAWRELRHAPEDLGVPIAWMTQGATVAQRLKP